MNMYDIDYKCTNLINKLDVRETNTEVASNNKAIRYKRIVTDIALIFVLIGFVIALHIYAK
jgi:hypothetical protein